MMKKILSVFAAGLIAASFFGCECDSDNDNAALLLAVSQKSGSSVGGVLPANEGENKLSGNTYKDGNTTCKFADSTYDVIEVSGTFNPFSLDENAFTYSEKATVTRTTTYRYAYGNNTIYSIKSSGKVEFKNGDKKYTLTSSITTYKSDDDYVDKYVNAVFDKDMYKALGWTKEPTEEQITNARNWAKNDRYSCFGLYGYTDTTSATKVSAEVLAKYNKAAAKQAEIDSKVIILNAYKFDGSNLQVADVGNYPKSITLASLYYGIYPFSKTLTDGCSIEISGATVLDAENVICNPMSRPAILLTDGITGFKIKSISDNGATLTGVTRSGAGTYADPYKWTAVGDFAAEFTPSKTESEISYTLKIDSVTLGTVTIPFTSTDSSTHYTTYTKQ